MIPPDVAALDAAIERSLSALGTLEPSVLSRLQPQSGSDQRPMPWPSEALGKLRIVRRPGGAVLFVTHGLSYPFDSSLHGPNVPTLGYELGVEVAGHEPIGDKTFATSTNHELANAWPVHALWFLSGCYVEDRWMLLDHLDQYGLVSGLVPPLPGLEKMVTTEHYVGVLQGIPLAAGGAGRKAQMLLARVGPLECRLVMLTVVTPDELAHIRSVPDATLAAVVVARLAERGLAYVSSAVRPSVLG